MLPWGWAARARRHPHGGRWVECVVRRSEAGHNWGYPEDQGLTTGHFGPVAPNKTCGVPVIDAAVRETAPTTLIHDTRRWSVLNSRLCDGRVRFIQPMQNVEFCDGRTYAYVLELPSRHRVR